MTEREREREREREDKRKGRRDEHNALKRKIISITQRLLNLAAAAAVTVACGERQRECERGGWSEGVDRDTLAQSGRRRTFNIQHQFGQRIISEKNQFRRKRSSSHETTRRDSREEGEGRKEGRRDADGGREGNRGKVGGARWRRARITVT